jgi:hypothetical protein
MLLRIPLQDPLEIKLDEIFQMVQDEAQGILEF